ncbi:chitobiosyldiphosphodolichol beta-mannosyltransferase-like [Copidosoma floridanum]|uniref:chitobiosyldiphosphodolichol beta-mannosyltransferase-like n=1 Tax=Copidosoma floridanum TaxID=29053 RepID=UPI000C6F7A58|nr:chitobiosyldiphosphodolichol beta-mannosyltransferase-like [Copidosoma floridanum]
MEFLAHSFGVSFVFGLLFALILKKRARTRRVCIVVLGDLGRSPRMQYHAISFAKEGYNVELVGYSGSQPHHELRDNANVKIHYLQSPPNWNDRVTKLLAYAIKVIWQSVNLLYVLFFKCSSTFLLLQNPPAIPTIPVCWFYCLIAKVEFAIDWHNYAHTIMALSLGQNHFLVKLATSIESYFGAKAAQNFCVTKAMQKDLNDKWNIKAKVLYDRPPEHFHPITLEEKYELYLKLSKEYSVFKGDEESSTIFAKKSSDGKIELLTNRPALIVSSTSWTEDEDFSILLEALDDYERECKSNETVKFPKLICAITGKGPLKDFYKAIIQKKNWKYVTVITPWLENEDYPKLLASADLGVCLHTSSSGLDLPMKVVDMFGCGLCVCAYKYNCLHELIKHNENSLVFTDARELGEQIQTLFKNFPNDSEQHQKIAQFKNKLAMYQKFRWHSNWTSEVLTCFECYVAASREQHTSMHSTMSFSVLLFVILSINNRFVLSAVLETNFNNRPIIGILTQEISYNLDKAYPGMYNSYIAASYVKFIESAGARVTPIWIGQNYSYYENILSKINGVLFPGGTTYFNQTDGYADAGECIYEIAKKLNRNNTHFPIWGTCLGFELLTYLEASRREHRETCSSSSQAIPLEFTKNFRNSRMFKDVPADVVDVLREKKVTVNFHQYCVTYEALAKVNLTEEFHIISYNHDRNDKKFISTFEHVAFPFYGVQFHPEKIQFEWVKGKNISHSFDAIKANRYFADFFVNEARKNFNHFSNVKEENEALIYNYPVTFTGLKGSPFEQCYMFKK